MSIKVTPELLRNTATSIQNNMDHAQVIAQNYLSTQQNAMGGNAWAGGGADSSNVTAMHVQEELSKILNGGTRLAEGLTKAAAIMESHEQDGAHAFSALFGGQSAAAV